MSGPAVTATAPGRVNLIGDHTDYAGGLALPMAIDLATTVHGRRGGGRLTLRSASEPDPADVALPVADPAGVVPLWARYVAAVAAELHAADGLVGTITSTVPTGAGLSSSAALEVSVALALGFAGDPLELARLCQRAEHRATGVPSGLMDQLTIAAGVEGHGLLMDFATDAVEPVPIPEGAEIVVVHSGQQRALVGSPYAQRRAAVEAAAAVVGPLRSARVDDLSQIADPVVARRARHVITENGRVLAFARSLRQGELTDAGRLMLESHASLRDDFQVSTPQLDALVTELARTPGVHGARLTGAGFGGCVVALADRAALAGRGWHVRASAGARVVLS